MVSASLVVVGSGIKFVSHLTTEAIIYIEKSEKVLYLVNEPAMKEWIENKNKNSVSLDIIYTQHELRIDSYHAITGSILDEVRKNQHVCVVLYGHPAVFAKPGIDAVIQAKKEGYPAKMLPGISAEDCLYADLLINVGTCGHQSFEATELLIHRRQCDPCAHLFLWQVGFIGALNHPRAHDNSKGIRLLVDYLNQYYNLEHIVTLYEAAQYPGFEPRITQLSLRELPEAKTSAITTLYVPPARKMECDKEMLEALTIQPLLSVTS